MSTPQESLQGCGSWLSGGAPGLRSALPSISRAEFAVCSRRKIPKWVPFPGWFASGGDFPLGKTKESAALCLQGKFHGRDPQWSRPPSPQSQCCEVGTGAHPEGKLEESEWGLSLESFSVITCKIEMTHVSQGLFTVIITTTMADTS